MNKAIFLSSNKEKAEEINLAFTPHATSKLENIDDLNTLTTMGFRGEALATISAVSKVKMLTKTKKWDIYKPVRLSNHLTRTTPIAIFQVI